MIVGVPKETRSSEFRVGLVPSGVEALRAAGHEVRVERGAGEGSGIPDDAYRAAGAEIVPGAPELWEGADLVVKVKEPTPEEWPFLRPDLVLFSFLHLAAAEPLTQALLEAGCVAIAFETVQLPGGELPLLVPMSEVAGRMAIQAGARHLEKPAGGRGLLLGGVPGVRPAEVLILGGGVVGSHAARMAAGLGAHVTILDVSLPRLRRLEEHLPANVEFVFSTRLEILEHLPRTDLLIGAVLQAGRRAPRLLLREDLARMQPGAVLVDVAVDQGGCVETIRPTTHADPTYVLEGVVHYGVANMPGAVPRTSTFALANATLPYVRALANHGWREACRRDSALALGVNAAAGRITHPGVAEAFGVEPTPPFDPA